MLEKFLNKRVLVCISHYAAAYERMYMGVGVIEAYQRKGVLTRLDNNFIELDNDEVVAIKYITTIKSL